MLTQFLVLVTFNPHYTLRLWIDATSLEEAFEMAKLMVADFGYYPSTFTLSQVKL